MNAFYRFLSLSEGDRAKSEAVLRDLCQHTGVSEREACRLIWIAAVEGFIQSRLEPTLSGDMERVMERTGGGKAIIRTIEGQLGCNHGK